jgi:hypothetical protein
MQVPTMHHIEKHGELLVPVSIQEICIDPTAVEDCGSKGEKLHSDWLYIFPA